MKKLIAIVLALAMVFALVACAAAPATEGETKEETKKEETKKEETKTEDTEKKTEGGKKYRIAMSNSFIGNDWRQEMQKITEYVAASDKYKDVLELTIINCENTPEAQSASIDAMVLEGYDAIIVDACSETALNPALQRALDAGIVCIAFDNVVTLDGVIKYGANMEVLAANMAEYMCAAVDFKGSFMVDRGLAGASQSGPLYDNAVEVFNSYDGIKIVYEFDSNYAEGDTVTGVQAGLASTPVVDGIYTVSFNNAAIQACQEAKRDIPVTSGFSYNSSFMALLENDADGCIGMNSAGIGADAMVMAYNVLTGAETYPTTDRIDSDIRLFVKDAAVAEKANLSLPYEVIEEGVNCYKGYPGGWQLPTCSDFVGVELPPEAFLD